MRRPLQTHQRAPRHTIRITAQVIRESDFRLVADRVVDLSPGGALVMPADPVLTGERLLVSFQLPRSLYFIDTEALVTRVLHGRRPGEHTRGLALAFDSISGLDRRMLEHALRHLPPAPPRFRRGRRETGPLLYRLVGENTTRTPRSLDD
jgi:hypothetical protein